jgi:hypothetical protein
MNKQLKSLTHFVREKLRLLSVAPRFGVDEIQKWTGYIEVTRDDIYEEVKAEVATLENKVRIELYIQHYHSSLISILNAVTVQGQKPVEELPEHIVEFYAFVAEAVQYLLNYTEQYFSQFSYHLEVPLLYLEAGKNEVKQHVYTIRKNLTEKDTVRLLRVILEPMESFLEQEDKVASYQELSYFRQLSAELAALKSSSHLRTDIQDILVRWNVNSDAFLQYLKSGMDEGMAESASREEKMERLSLWSKQFRQMTVREQVALVPGSRSVMDFALRYIEEEKLFLEREAAALDETVAGTPLPVKVAKDASVPAPGLGAKMTTSANMSELAGFIKVMIEAGVITNTVVLDIIRFFAEHFGTPNMEVIKYDSLRTKFYNIDMTTGKAVIELCSSLLNTARSLFG